MEKGSVQIYYGAGRGKTNAAPVSYTHLDVYKRQEECRSGEGRNLY